MAVFRAEEERAVRELLGAVELPVELALVLGPYATTTIAGARELDPERETRAILEAVAALCDRVEVTEHGEGAFGVDRYPAVVALRDGADLGVRFYGTPWGYELTSVVGAVLELGRPEPSLAPDSVAALVAIGRELSLDVFVTPT